MTLLDRCAGGNILERPQPLDKAIDLDAAAALRQRILDDCLPAQRAFLEDEEHRILGYIGG